MVTAQVSNPYIIVGNISALYIFNPWIMEQKNSSFMELGTFCTDTFKSIFSTLFFLRFD